MIIKSQLIDASLQPVTTAGEATLPNEVGRFYLNVETNEIIVGNGSGFTRFRQEDDGLGDVKTSMLNEAGFQAQHDSRWVIMHGSAQDSSDWATLVKKSSNPKTRINKVLSSDGFSVTEEIYIEAVNVNGAPAVIDNTYFDGVVDDIDAAVSAFNIANPTNQMVVIEGGDQIPHNSVVINISAYVPDARALYMRAYDDGNRPPAEPELDNPESKELGEIQTDTSAVILPYQSTGQQGYLGGAGGALLPHGIVTDPSYGTLYGGNETRPKTFIVNHFMKVNI